MIKVYENVFVLCIISACFSSFFISYLCMTGEKRGDKHCIEFFYDAFSRFFHTLYEIFVLCIIYCTPQNSGGKCVLTENIVKIQKIYDAIEEKTQEELWRKNHTINQKQFFPLIFSTGPFHFLNLICFPGKNCKRKKCWKIKFMNMPVQSHGGSERERQQKILHFEV